MVEDGEAFDEAPDASTLLRAYAGHIAKNTRAAPHELGALRERYQRARAGLPRPAQDAPEVVSTPTAWVRTFVGGRTSAQDLEDALHEVVERAPESGEHLRRLLDAYPGWLRARADPRASTDLLRLVVQALRPGGEAPQVEPDEALRRAALRARRDHPGLVALAPTVFGDLLRPDYRGGAPVTQQAPPRRARAASGRRRSSQSSGMSGWTWVLLFVGLSGLVRACNRTNQGSTRTTPTLQEQYEEMQERSRERLKRLERFKRSRWHGDDDSEKDGK